MKNFNIFSLISEYDNAKSRGVLNEPNVSFVDEDSSVRYLIDPYNGYEYVDLGLSVKWATCNVGATSPEQAGLYFAWGETTGYTGEQVTSGVKAFSEDEYNIGPAASISADLTPEQDAAHINMGDNWRIPTKAECQELIDNCDVVWTDDYNGTGVIGKVFTSKVNGNSVFFPANGYFYNSYVNDGGLYGYYWSASWDLYSRTWVFSFGSEEHRVYSGPRYVGQLVRGVCE